MPESAEMIDHLGSNVTFLCDLVRMTAEDGEVWAVASHSHEDGVTFNSVTYESLPITVTRRLCKIGLDPDSAEITAPYDDIVTEEDVRGGRWEDARIYMATVNFFNLSIGATDEHGGFAGKVRPLRGRFVVEFRSKSSKLAQTLGDLTSATDRNVTIAETGEDEGAFTHAAEVTAVTDRRKFTVGITPADNLFKYGRAEWLTGANADLVMEVKGNTAGLIELQLPMRSEIEVGDTLNLVEGYDGTRETARDTVGGDAVLNMQAEPDLPGLGPLMRFPE
jgi:uncharacterized phage protein (TIGR02218 family)